RLCLAGAQQCRAPTNESEFEHAPSARRYHVLFSSRRTFLRSLSRSALVLPLENILALVRPAWGRLGRSGAAQSANAGAAQKSASASSGGFDVSFVNVSREAGLNVKTIFGGEHKNKYLLETTGCGVAFYDYDNDGWLDIF